MAGVYATEPLNGEPTGLLSDPCDGPETIFQLTAPTGPKLSASSVTVVRPAAFSASGCAM
jgi:hypothetical protein